MSSRLVLPFIAAFACAAIICCSSSDDAPPAQPVDGGPGTDATGGGNDAATDAPPSTSSADYKSGTRLRANVLTADGVALWTSWKDTKLGVDCEFGLAEDKQLRCVPMVDTLDGVTFSDAACTKAVHRGRPACKAPTIVRKLSTTCGVGDSAVRLGAVVDTAVVYEKSGAACNQIPVTGFDVYPVMAAIAPAELVLGTTKQVDAGGGLAKTVLDAEDGASQIRAIYDTTRKTTCTRGGGTKDDRCVPTNLGFEEQVFSEMTCMTPAAYRPAYGYDCTSPPAVILKVGQPGMCGVYEAQYVEVGAKVTTGTFFRKGVTTCDDASITPTQFDSYWGFGAAIAQTSFPALGNIDEGAGRIKLRVDATSSSARLRGRAFFDSERKEPCTLLPTSDGVERCSPLTRGNTQANYFSDDQCQKPVAEVEAACAPSTFVHTFESGSGCSIPKHRFYKVGAKITPAQLYNRNGSNGCIVATLTGGYEYYDAAIELPPSTFVALTRKTE